MTISITITCDPADIAALIQTITTPGAGLTKNDITALIDHTIHQLGLAPAAEPVEAAAAIIIHPITPITPIPPPTVVSPTVPPDETDEKKIAKRLSFAELDPLVRSEMKRLSMDGRMPNTKLWDTERDPRLPTMTGLYYRYNVANMLDLATMMGLQPPLTYKNTNGAQPITA